MNRLYIIICVFLSALLSACSDSGTDTVVVRRGTETYRGQMSGGKRNGYGVLTIGDSVVYSGQWKDGRRCGYGYTVDSTGVRITALWNRDSIVSGMRRDSLGLYHGGFDTSLRADGHGSWLSADGSFYTGQWVAGRRSGVGCGVDSHGKVSPGDWRSGRYRGERMLHTSSRIYGIDLSRHQHEKGKKKYSIDWNSLRITGLGSADKQRSRGSVSYPVSFVYVKSTEGTTVYNKYFRSDYLQARAHGIRVGAYHFFSTKSTASAQAAFFLKKSVFRKGDLPPVLDVEPTEEQIRQIGGTAELLRRMRVWLRAVRNATGVSPVLYVGQGFVAKHLSQAPDLTASYPVWIARYGQYRPDIRLAFWQLTPYGRVRGIQGDVDVNVFNGYSEQFREFLQREAIK